MIQSLLLGGVLDLSTELVFLLCRRGGVLLRLLPLAVLGGVSLLLLSLLAPLGGVSLLLLSLRLLGGVRLGLLLTEGLSLLLLALGGVEARRGGEAEALRALALGGGEGLLDTDGLSRRRVLRGGVGEREGDGV